MATIVEIRRMFERARNPQHSEREFYQAQVRKLPKEIQALESLSSNDAEFFKAYFKVTEELAAKAKAAKAAKTATEQQPEDSAPDATDLLPFKEFPGYALDVWGRPHGVSGQGRKRGPLTPDKHWKPRKKGQKAVFVWRFRLYRDGERVDRSAKFCMIARHNAERALWDHSKGEDEELRSMGVHD